MKMINRCLFLLPFFSLSGSVDGFRPVGTQCRNQLLKEPIGKKHAPVAWGQTRLRLSGEEDTPDDTDIDADITKDVEPVPDRSKSAAKKWLDVFSTLTTGFIYAFAAAVGVGLLLNLLGYGYTVSLENGIRVDTLSELRMEQSLQASSPRPSRGGIGEFFFKQPFVASLLVTGCVLAIESLLSATRKGGDGN